MPVLMSSAEMSQLAQKLAKMRYWRAKWYSWGLDKKAHYDMWRVALRTEEWHTRLTLPNKGIRITFVEKKVQVGRPNSAGLVQTRYRYVEARVEPTPVLVEDKVDERMNVVW